MAQADGVIITTRRNFLVRAAGFLAVASPAVAAVALAKPDVPMITPDIVEKIAAWKQAYLDKEAIHGGGRLPHPLDDDPYNHANERQWAALHDMQRAILNT